jgi:hypothetical protein
MNDNLEMRLEKPDMPISVKNQLKLGSGFDNWPIEENVLTFTNLPIACLAPQLRITSFFK